MSVSDPWELKYLPKSVDEYIFQSDYQRRIVDKILEDKDFTKLLLSGHHGTGKTSLAYMLKHELGVDDIDFLKVNASKNTSKSFIETKVDQFVSVMPMSSPFKIVFFDEADRLSPEAQDALKGVMDESMENARFIFTCNQPRKIIDPIKSRCVQIEYKSLDKDEMLFRFASILKAEKVKLDEKVINEYVDNCYPDFRQLLLCAQASVKDGVLQTFEASVSNTAEFMVSIIDHIETGNWTAARTFLATHVPDDGWEGCYTFLYQYLHEIGKFKDDDKWAAGIVTINDYLYRHQMVADPELNFAAFMIKLSEI